MIPLGYIFSIIYGAVCILAGTVLYKFGIDKRYTRKLVHILIGAEWFILYHTVGVGVHFFLVCLLFTLSLAIEYRMKFLPAMSSSGDNAPGTVYYGASMTVLSFASIFIPDLIFPFGIAVLCTSLGDGIGGIVGSSVKRRNSKIYREKTLFGTVSMLFVSFVSIFLFSLAYGYRISILSIFLLALFAASVELVSLRGLDNLTVPISTAILAYVISLFPLLESYLLAVSALPLVIAVIYEKRALTAKGTAVAAALALLSSAAFRNSGALLLIIYFCAAILTDKIKNIVKKAGQNSTGIAEAKSQRNAYQVIQNGGAAFVFAVLHLAFPSEIFAAGFVVSLAESLADTAASGIGSLSDNVYDITRFNRCRVGLDGGVSLLGTLSALVFASTFSALAYLFGVLSPGTAALCAAFAFFGMLIDSALGSRLQPKYKCPICSSLTDKSECCDTKCDMHSGIKWVTNGTVNLISSLLASVLLCITLLAIN